MREKFGDFFKAFVTYVTQKKILVHQIVPLGDLDDKHFSIDGIHDQDYIKDLIECFILRGFNFLREKNIQLLENGEPKSSVTENVGEVVKDLKYFLSFASFNYSLRQSTIDKELLEDFSGNKINPDEINEYFKTDLINVVDKYHSILIDEIRIYNIKLTTTQFKLAGSVNDDILKKLFNELSNFPNNIIECSETTFLDCMKGLGTKDNPIKINSGASLRSLLAFFKSNNLVENNDQINLYFDNNFVLPNGKKVGAEFIRKNSKNVTNKSIKEALKKVFNI
ncbi:MAG: hypothetical protein RLZZ44_461 [Bacteroidota bacterium]|jgi:hypothetical protein